MNQEGPEIKNVITKGRNGEERAGIFDDGMFAEMPGGENHVKAEMIGRPSILRALLERASRGNIHSKKKYEEALDMKNKDTLNRINNQNKWETQIHNAVWRDTLSKSINENNQREKININPNTNQKKWKNIMTLIHNSALQNINLTCGGNCILRKKTSENENSCRETVSMHSGTDSQYEKISPDVSPVRQSEENLPSDAVKYKPESKFVC